MMIDPVPLDLRDTISIIHPSRSRPQKSYETIRKWIESSLGLASVQIIITLDSDDQNINEYLQLYQGYYVMINPNKSSVEAINIAAKKATGNILMVVSDDTEPPVFWDEKIILNTIGKSDFIVKTKDGIQDWIITMPIMDRAYYNRFGYIYYPGYQHLFCDTELTCVADILGRKITFNLLFPHNHYSIGKATLDSVYSKNDRTNEQGEKLFLERYARNFDLPPGNPIKDLGLINWLKKRRVA